MRGSKETAAQPEHPHAGGAVPTTSSRKNSNDCPLPLLSLHSSAQTTMYTNKIYNYRATGVGSTAVGASGDSEGGINRVVHLSTRKHQSLQPLPPSPQNEMHPTTTKTKSNNKQRQNTRGAAVTHRALHAFRALTSKRLIKGAGKNEKEHRSARARFASNNATGTVKTISA